MDVLYIYIIMFVFSASPSAGFIVTQNNLDGGKESTDLEIGEDSRSLCMKPGKHTVNTPT